MEYLRVCVLVVSLHSCCQPIYRMTTVYVYVCAEGGPTPVLPANQKELHWKARLVHPGQQQKIKSGERIFSDVGEIFSLFLFACYCSCCSSNSNSSSSVWKTHMLFVRCNCCSFITRCGSTGWSGRLPTRTRRRWTAPTARVQPGTFPQRPCSIWAHCRAGWCCGWPSRWPCGFSAAEPLFAVFGFGVFSMCAVEEEQEKAIVLKRLWNSCHYYTFVRRQDWGQRNEVLNINIDSFTNTKFPDLSTFCEGMSRVESYT